MLKKIRSLKRIKRDTAVILNNYFKKEVNATQCCSRDWAGTHVKAAADKGIGHDGEGRGAKYFSITSVWTSSST